MTIPPTASADASPRRRRAIIVGAAALAPAAPWLAAQLLDIDLKVSTGGQPPMTIGLPMVVTTALVGALAGWGALAVMRRLTVHARTVWTVAAVIALLASLALPLTAQTNTGARIILVLMHFCVAAVLVPGLRRTTPAPRRSPQPATS